MLTTQRCHLMDIPIPTVRASILAELSDSATADFDHANLNSDYESVDSMDNISYFDCIQSYSEQVNTSFDSSLFHSDCSITNLRALTL